MKAKIRDRDLIKKYKLPALAVLALLVISILNITYRVSREKNAPIPVDAETSTLPVKGINWNMGEWYVNGQYNWDGMGQDLDLMQKANIKYVRFSFGKHTQSSCSETGFYTKLANEFDKRNLKGLASITIPDHQTTTATTDALSSYKSWLTTMAGCYKNRFKDWEVWNEPNNNNFWNIDYRTTNDSAYAKSVSYYIAYLRTTYNTIKSIDPTANVILGGVTQNWAVKLSDGRTIGTMTRWMNEFLKQEGYKYIDSWGFHPYADYDPNKSYSYKDFTGCGTENIKRIDEFKNYTNSDSIPIGYRNKPLWLTEIGYTSTADEYPGNTKGSEKVKAGCIVDTWNKFKSIGIKTPVFLFDFSKDNLLSVRQEGYSLVPSNKNTNEYKLNPSYNSYKSLWSVTPTPSPAPTPATLISDSFTRNVTGGWGAANAGGAYTLFGSSSDFYVDGDEGKMNIVATSTQRSVVLTQISLRDEEVIAKFRTGKIPYSGDAFMSLLTRYGDIGHYRLSVRMRDGGLYLLAQKYIRENNSTTNLSSPQIINGLTQVAGNALWIKGKIIGVDPTVIKIKIWAGGQNEPSDWQYTVQDNSGSQIRTNGNTGLFSRIGSNVSNAPILFSFDNYSVKGL